MSRFTIKNLRAVVDTANEFPIEHTHNAGCFAKYKVSCAYGGYKVVLRFADTSEVNLTGCSGYHSAREACEKFCNYLFDNVGGETAHGVYDVAYEMGIRL